jgi:DNA processing protein
MQPRHDATALANVVVRTCHQQGIRMLMRDANDYPGTLRALPDPPIVLFALGEVSLCDRPAVALVGTREATPYGARCAARLGTGVGGAGAVVVSGLARGVDAVAHEAALGTPGSTIAVLGCGVDVVYPQANAALRLAIAQRGLLVSEMLPGERPHAGSFPRRNRLIAALADLTVVVEAGVRSGALITAAVAAELGRLTGAVPGPVDTPTSEGANALLRDGAHVVTGVADVITLLHLTTRGRSLSVQLCPAARDVSTLSDDEARVWNVLRDGARHPDELLTITRLSAAALGSAVSSLSLRGMAEQDVHGVLRICVSD